MDVVKTRLMNQGAVLCLDGGIFLADFSFSLSLTHTLSILGKMAAAGEVHYSGMVDCFLKTAKMVRVCG